MNYAYASLTDVGRNRSNNEDAVGVHPHTGVVVLADGMGGYNAGEVASDMAVRQVGQALSDWSASLDRSQCRTEQLHAMLDCCISEASAAIYRAACENPQYMGMGTTLVVGLFDRQRVVLAHVGDSRAYCWRDQKLVQLTRDHSLLQEQIDLGLISPEQAQSASYKNLITRALGVEQDVQIDIVEHEPRWQDVFLLCSDGLSDMLSEDDIQRCLALPLALQDRAQALVAAANAAGGRDNIAVILVQAEQAPAFADTQPSQD